MDILTHTLSGISAGTVISSYSTQNRLKIILASSIGAIIPDWDVISLWSQFDKTIGRIFNLQQTGKEIYFSKLWFSHHAFLHSILAGFSITVLIGLLLHSFNRQQKTQIYKDLKQSFNIHRLILLGFFSGFIMHLIGDLPTPSSVWGGINLFWPLKSYVGGTGEIWWWNNYDLFLITACIVVLNGLIIIASYLIKIKPFKFTCIIFTIGFLICLLQIKTREYDFNYKGHTPRYNKLELKSQEIQKGILNKDVYNTILEFDNKMPINF